MSSYPWHPVAHKPGYYTCTEHGGEWTRGKVCPRCDVGTVSYGAKESEAELLQRQAVEAGMPSTLDHERWYLALADQAKQAGDKLLNPPRVRGKKAVGRPAKSLIAAHRLLDLALKARRAAASLTEWREDWARTERLRRNAVRNGGVGRGGVAWAPQPGDGGN